MLLPVARYAFVVLLFVACVGCDSDSDGNGNGNGNGSGAAMTATVEGEAFSTDDVFIAGSFGNGFVFTGTDGDRTLFINLQGEAVTPGTYPLGQGTEPTEYIAGGSFVDDSRAENNVYNTAPGSGVIVLQSYSAGGASGTFEFTAMNTAGESVTVANGAFDVDF